MRRPAPAWRRSCGSAPATSIRHSAFARGRFRPEHRTFCRLPTHLVRLAAAAERPILRPRSFGPRPTRLSASRRRMSATFSACSPRPRILPRSRANSRSAIGHPRALPPICARNSTGRRWRRWSSSPSRPPRRERRRLSGRRWTCRAYSNLNTIGTSAAPATGVPPTVLGVKRDWRTAFSAASSRLGEPLPCARLTDTAAPAAETSTWTSTRPCSCRRSAAGG